MRVLHFFKTYWPDTFGGVERTIHAIAKGAAAHGVTSSVLSLSPNPGENSVLFDGHEARKAGLDFEFASTGFSRDVFAKFRQMSAQADIVHYHFPWPMMDVVHFAVKHHKPTVVTYHSDIVKQKMLLRLYRPLMMRFLGNVDRIVATSSNYVDSSPVLAHFREKTSVIPIGLFEDSYPPVNDALMARWRERLPSRFFLFTGVLRYYKGAHILLEAARMCGLPVVIVGSGPMERELKASKDRLGIDNVFFLGSLPDEDKIALLALSLGFVFPSNLRSEAYGLSLVEAAMLGKPMISCELGTGTSFVNQAGVTGLVTMPDDPQGLADAMTALWTNPTMATGCGLAARQRYEQHLTGEGMASAYCDLYRELSTR
jgi:glycosyltransferase involved in cell wall biosynthesis